MTKVKWRNTEVDEQELRSTRREDHATGVTAVAAAMNRSLERTGALRTERTLTTQPGRRLRLLELRVTTRSPGTSGVLRESAQGCRRGGHHEPGARESFAAGRIAERDRHCELWLGQRGRITGPRLRRPGGIDYQPTG